MRQLGNLLAVVGIVLFVYTIVGRFVGEKGLCGFTQAMPCLGQGFSAVGMFAGTSCILLIAVILLLNSKK